MGWVHYFFHRLLSGVYITVLVMAGDFFLFFWPGSFTVKVKSDQLETLVCLSWNKEHPLHLKTYKDLMWLLYLFLQSLWLCPRLSAMSLLFCSEPPSVTYCVKIFVCFFYVAWQLYKPTIQVKKNQNQHIFWYNFWVWAVKYAQFVINKQMPKQLLMHDSCLSFCPSQT